MLEQSCPRGCFRTRELDCRDAGNGPRFAGGETARILPCNREEDACSAFSLEILRLSMPFAGSTYPLTHPLTIGRPVTAFRVANRAAIGPPPAARPSPNNRRKAAKRGVGFPPLCAVDRKPYS